jgi:hypothetical protein
MYAVLKRLGASGAFLSPRRLTLFVGFSFTIEEAVFIVLY